MLNLSNPSLLKTQSYIQGEFYSAEHYFPVTDPATEKLVASVCEASPEQVVMAVNSAHKALIVWQEKTVDERAAILRRWYELIIENQETLARIMTAEQGKSLSEAKGEVVYGAKYVQWYAEEARRINGDVLPVNQKGRRAMVLQRPIGVVASITPWNFPSAMILRKAAPALAAGCTFIVKPSELTPLSALALAALSEEAGIPAGVFNVLVGSNAQAIGEVLTSHPLIAKFSFTGSTAVGKKLLAQCASTVKKTSMELGGNAPLIVFEDADLAVAVKGAMASKFRNAGQTCVCANRIFVHESVLDKFISQFKQQAEALIVGNGLDTESNVGPLIEKRAVEKVERLVNQAIKSGAELLLGGKRAEAGDNFYLPTILTGVTPEMDIFNTEIFGPVAAIIPFSSEPEVIQLANKTPYGLCSYAFTQNMKRLWRLAEQLEFGMVGINEGVLSNPAAPFGGVKESGMGREGGRWGISDYLETRYVCLGDID